MSKIKLSLLILLIFLIMPSVAKEGALLGLKLWLFTIFPTLFPFIFITEIIKRIGAIPIITKHIFPIAGKILKLSPYGTYPLVLGLLCGFPMGAKTANDMVSDNHITINEGKYLLTFTNMLSPGFIIGYYCENVLKGAYSPVLILFIVYLSQLLTCFVFKITVFRQENFLQRKLTYKSTITNSLKNEKISLDEILLVTFSNIFKISGYIILFSIVCRYISLLPLNQYIKIILTSLCEVTTGTNTLGSLNIPSNIKFIIGNAAITFGGLSGIFQTHTMIREHINGTKIYVYSRIISTVFSILLSSIFILF